MDLAFTIVTHRDVRQFARLLRMIYRPNNYYCVHIDGRSLEIYVKAISGLVRCFGSNVQLVPRDMRINVTWGDETVLLTQRVCAKMALDQHATWKYLINLAGQEFPLRTNRELVAIGKALNSSVLVEAMQPGIFWDRTKGVNLPFQVKSHLQ